MDFSWTTVAVMLLNVLFGGVIVAIIKNRVPMRKIETEREANLLHERAEEMAGMRERLEMIEKKLDEKDAFIERKDQQMEAERAMYRHRIGNLGQAFHALLMLLKKGVDVADAVAEIERMRSEQMDREIAEAAMFRAAGINLGIPDPYKSDELNCAEHTARDTKQADITANAAVDTIKRKEAEG